MTGFVCERHGVDITFFPGRLGIRIRTTKQKGSAKPSVRPFLCADIFWLPEKSNLHHWWKVGLGPFPFQPQKQLHFSSETGLPTFLGLTVSSSTSHPRDFHEATPSRAPHPLARGLDLREVLQHRSAVDAKRLPQPLGPRTRGALPCSKPLVRFAESPAAGDVGPCNEVVSTSGGKRLHWGGCLGCSCAYLVLWFLKGGERVLVECYNWWSPQSEYQTNIFPNTAAKTQRALASLSPNG